MVAMQPAEAAPRTAEFAIVTRRLSHAWPAIERAVSDPTILPVGGRLLLRSGALRLDSGFEPDNSGLVAGRMAQGRLLVFGPLAVRLHRVSIAVAPWSNSACELRVSPRARDVHQWSTRRQRGFFRLAHEAADRMSELLAGGAPGLP